MSEVIQYEVPRKEVATASHDNLLQYALEKGASLDQLEKFMELKERHEATEARKAFHEALAAFKRNPPAVVKDKENKQYKSMYTSLANLVNTVNTGLSEHGLNARWDYKQDDATIAVTCILSHVLGHSERVTLAAPPDTSGAKNQIQQIKSTTTYLKAATFEAATGIASSDANLDDDGNASGSPLPEIDQELMAEAFAAADKGVEAYKAAWEGWTQEQRKALAPVHPGLKSRASQADARG